MKYFLQFKFKLINTYSNKEECVKDRKTRGAIILTAGGTPATVAKKSHIRPFHNIRIRAVGSESSNYLPASRGSAPTRTRSRHGGGEEDQ